MTFTEPVGSEDGNLPLKLIQAVVVHAPSEQICHQAAETLYAARRTGTNPWRQALA
jgi:hypothetical protein